MITLIDLASIVVLLLQLFINLIVNKPILFFFLVDMMTIGIPPHLFNLFPLTINPKSIKLRS